MLKHRVWTALAFAGLLLFGRGAVTLANACANWNTTYNDPSTVDISDISGVIAKTVPYSDPMDDVRRRLLLVYRPTGSVAVSVTISTDGGSPRAHRPRAPPSV